MMETPSRGSLGKPGAVTCEGFAPPCAWIWRGTVRSRWESMGFDSQMFQLFMRMRGARTRSNILHTLSSPMDRLQLAQELDLDWSAVDYHVVLLNKHGLVKEDFAFGRVRMYRLTNLGESLLRLLGEFDG